MAKRMKWNPQLVIQFEEVSDIKFAKTVAELGELIYKQIRNCQLLNQIDHPSQPDPSESHRNTGRKVAND